MNTDQEYFYHGSRGWYCRRCISFGRALIEEEKEAVSLKEIPAGSEEYILQYPLTQAQARIASACAQYVKSGDILLHCACGAGKTEIVVQSIAEALKERKKVCFAIPRRQVVLELRERLAQYFPHARVIAVCGGHTAETDGDLIICTTHQLYRYYQAFDLLILDEPDAFPYKDNAVLHGIAASACRGHRIYLTATPDAELKDMKEKGIITELVLNRRPHGHPLPVPQIHTGFHLFLLIRLVRWTRQHRDHPRMVFVPTIAAAEGLGRFLCLFDKCMICTSRTENRDAVIERFRSCGNGLIVCTSILERGVTVSGTDVAVYNADHAVFDEASLIQIAGRAGRSFQKPDGDVLFLCRTKSSLAEKCRRQLEEANRCAV